MPLTMLNRNVEAVLKMCQVKDATRKFLEGLGVLPGTKITVLSELNGNLIILVKGSRLAISKGVAQRLFVETV